MSKEDRHAPALRPSPRPFGTPLVAPNGEFAPIAAINTTPLIDLMLVLLIMFILAVPVATHEVPLDLPQPGPADPAERIAHRLDVGAGGELRWNGEAIGDAALGARLARLAAEPGAELHLWVDGEARYERVDRLLADIQRAGVARLGFLGNERFAGAIER